MKWWLTVFFLMGDHWISGDHVDGWGSRAFETRIECEQRRQFADTRTKQSPFNVKAVWVCNQGQPASKPPPPTLEVRRSQSFAQLQGSPGEADLPAADIPPSSVHPGLQLFTHKDQSWIAEDAIGLRFSGPLSPPLAETLRELLLNGPQIYNHVVLELDSPGGELRYVRKIVEVLAEVRQRATLVTRVMGAQVCASGCVAIYMQGTERKASGASVWVFHGACSAGSNVPSESDTEEYLELLEISGVSTNFLCELRKKGYVSKPGNLFLSGYELFHVSKAGIITELLPSWQPEDPVLPRVYMPR